MDENKFLTHIQSPQQSHQVSVHIEKETKGKVHSAM